MVRSTASPLSPTCERPTLCTGDSAALTASPAHRFGCRDRVRRLRSFSGLLVTSNGMLHLYDTLSRRKVELEPRSAGQVSMYVCGPTPYDLAHLGHGRTAIVFDTMRRYLAWSGFAVTYVSNVTDVEDKIIARAASRGNHRGRGRESLQRRRTGTTSTASASVVPTRCRTPPSSSTRCTRWSRSWWKAVTRT